jgi:hypothetical protein
MNELPSNSLIQVVALLLRDEEARKRFNESAHAFMEEHALSTDKREALLQIGADPKRLCLAMVPEIAWGAWPALRSEACGEGGVSFDYPTPPEPIIPEVSPHRTVVGEEVELELTTKTIPLDAGGPALQVQIVDPDGNRSPLPIASQAGTMAGG